ncbi:N-acetylglucosamine-6-sulfatase [Desulfatibacillum alkenivorans DSM 16219]|jgi:N-acetylglucosamine-6-sulfatase|uniref:N-acetylglucosamine-6-sulfatase n=1 Tax=Desulfatibacillum alkenivorans DSM 16219 TaxID=1121393 RepID=A0A1M6GA74_9BACT|nr:sulfatase-like hydrolase/transferase [Desulfatibacillum alkenivorans]SHJ06841.1 N-acetylglucosamine-6-sulfatase [Desulfatibacillum alkenivorans DSM 16219]
MAEKNISRRGALRLMAAASVAGAAGGFPRSLFSAPTNGKKPNVLFILTDDHRYDHMGCAGHPFIQTPNLDRLATQGVYFNNSFVTSSLCSPSRASFLTGQYAHTHGVQNNLTPWNNDNVTFLERFKQAGYDTAFLGKWHMPGELPKLRGVDEFVTFTVRGGQGQYWDCPLIVNGEDAMPNKRYITEELTDRAINFIDRDSDNPFCLYLSLKAAHHDWKPPTDLKDLYSDEELPLAEEADTWVTMTNGAVFCGTTGTLQYHYRNYCRVVTSVDRQVGRLLKLLDDKGLADNTIVVYAGDNGYFWGEHRKIDKRWAYEESIRVPFMIRAPGVVPDPGRKANQMALNIDLAPTLFDLAGIEPHAGMEGQSLAPILKNGRTPGREAWLYEYFKDYPYNVPAIQAIRTQNNIYIEYDSSRKPEYYDLKADPKEKHNLYDQLDAADISRYQQMIAALAKEGRL